MDPYLRMALEEIDRVADRIDLARLGESTTGRWSIAEILEHLTLAFTVTQSVLEQALASGELRVRSPRLMQRLARVLVVQIGYFPRVQAPEMTRPRGHIRADQSLPAIREALGRLDETLSRVASRFGERVAVANHPYFDGLTVHQWRKFHWRHTKHHMRQVRERARGMGEPRG